MSLQGFDILNQKKRKKKTFMDYEPGHVGDDNYVITEPRITPKTTTTNKSGTVKNTSTITKEPKHEPFSRFDDDPLKGWDHRLFLEGFYEVEGARTDWEREERMAQVDEALKDIEKRNRKTTPGASLHTTLPGRIDTSKIQKLPYKPTSPAQVTNLPYYGNRYSGYTKYQNAANTNTATTTSGNTRPPTKEEMKAAYADMQNKFSGQNAWKHMEDVVDFVTNAATPQNNTQGKTQTATTTNTAQTQSRDERDANVRENYRARQQAEADARYENFDIEAAEEKLRDNDYWTDRLLESRRQGYGFAGDERVEEERRALEEEIKRAKEAAERRRERYIREKVAQMPESKPGDMLRWSAENPTFNPVASQKEIHKAYYNEDRGIYGTGIDELLSKQTVNQPGISGKDIISKIPFEQAKYPYAQRALDKLVTQPHTTGELNNLARAAMHSDEIPVISGTRNITTGKSKIPVKVPNVSGKAVSTFAGEAMNIASYVWDSQEIMSAVSADLKDDGQIGKDTVKTTAKVVAGNVGGAVAGWAAGEILTLLLGASTGLIGSTILLAGKLAAIVGGSYLAEESVDKIFEDR